MTVSLFHRFQVKDFAAWLNPDPGVPAKLMKDNGVLAYSLHRNPDDPNTLMVYCQFPDMTTLQAYVALVEGFPGEMKNFFAVPGTVEWWVGEDVPGYSINR
jgi:hypothetical protein